MNVLIRFTKLLLLGPCSIKGIQGYRILPVVRPSRKAGHDSENIIEISLLKKLELRNSDELEVTFPDKIL